MTTPLIMIEKAALDDADLVGMKMYPGARIKCARPSDVEVAKFNKVRAPEGGYTE